MLSIITRCLSVARGTVCVVMAISTECTFANEHQIPKKSESLTLGFDISDLRQIAELVT